MLVSSEEAIWRAVADKSADAAIGDVVANQLLFRSAYGQDLMEAGAPLSDTRYLGVGAGVAVRLAVAKRRFSVGEQVLPVTIRLGYISDDGSHSREDLLNAADKALYQAKAAGRNRWVQAPALS